MNIEFSEKLAKSALLGQIDDFFNLVYILYTEMDNIALLCRLSKQRQIHHLHPAG